LTDPELSTEFLLYLGFSNFLKFDLGTIFTAANLPLLTFFANRTRPVDPLPNVRPSFHGPMRFWVLRFFAELLVFVEICESLLVALVTDCTTLSMFSVDSYLVGDGFTNFPSD
jgi:hypothetical protein